MSESVIPGKESLMTEISLVLDSKVCPTIPSMPVAISMNFEAGQEERKYAAHASTHRALASACGAHDAVQHISSG